MEKYKKLQIIAVVFFFLSLSLSGSWQQELVEFYSQPVLSNGSNDAYYPSVIFDPLHFGETTGDSLGSGSETYLTIPYYKMWFSNGAGVGFAYSNNGINWTISSGGSVTGLTNPHHVSLIYSGGNYYIWYWDTSELYSHSSIRYAESLDGISWSNDQTTTGNLITGVSPDWNRGSYGPCQVFYNDSASNTGSNPFNYSFYMYFDGTTGGVEETGLGYSANGINWQLYGRVLPHGNTGDWDSAYASRGTVARIDPTEWHMWYSGGATRLHEGIGHATSTDGLNWTKDAGNPVWHITDGVSYRNSRTYTPWILYRQDRFAGTGDNIQFKGWFTARSGSSVRTICYLGTNQLSDLSLNMTISNNSPANGETVTYTITVYNGGNTDASGVTIADILPSGVSFTGYTSSSGTYSEISGIWDIGPVSNGTSESLYLTVRINTSDAVTNSAEVSTSDQPDPDSEPDNNEPGEDDQDSITTTGNSSPVAIIGGDSFVCPVPAIIELSAINSYDKDGKIVEYHWTLQSKPSNSSAELSNPAAQILVLTADRPGEYIIALRVRDNSDQWSNTVQRVINAGLGEVPDIRITGKRKSEKSWIIIKDYVDLSLEIRKKSICQMKINRLFVYRKTTGSTERLILELDPTQFTSGPESFIYNFIDKFIDHKKVYSYIFKVTDHLDSVIAESSIVLNTL